MGNNLDKLPRPHSGRKYEPKVIPPEHQAILDRPLAPNGLAWRKWVCERCGCYLCDQGVLIGAIMRKCPECKFPNVMEFNRVGEEQLLEYLEERAAQRLPGKTLPPQGQGQIGRVTDGGIGDMDDGRIIG